MEEVIRLSLAVLLVNGIGRVFFRLTDDRLEMTVRFVTEEHGIRVIKDAMSREIMDRFDDARIGLASGTYEVVGVPELRVRVKNE